MLCGLGGLGGLGATGLGLDSIIGPAEQQARDAQYEAAQQLARLRAEYAKHKPEEVEQPELKLIEYKEKDNG